MSTVDRRESQATAQEETRTRQTGIIVICTRNRPAEIRASCVAAHASSPTMPILVLDASTNNATHEVCTSLLHDSPHTLALIYRRASQPGLARQRNEAVGICRQLGVAVVHFIDDDTEVMAGYFGAIERRFRSEPTVMGLGGIILNQPRVHFVAVKSFFLLVSRCPGSVLRSGRNTSGQYPDTRATDPVDWLNGCSMSFRMSVFDEVMFDDDLQGYSMGEDYDFTFRVSRTHRLAVEPSAICVHHRTPTMRGSVRTLGRQRTEATHRWTRAHKHLDMSLAAFWWSTLGDLILHIGYGVLRMNRESLEDALGIIEGVKRIIFGRARVT